MSKKKQESVEPVVQDNSHVDELKGQLARVLADYDNLQKRVARDREEGKYLSKLIVVSRLLPVFDMFEDAQKHTGDAGMGIALKVLHDTLKDEGITEIVVTEGMPFNHEEHEAIDTVESTDQEDGTVASVALKGYKFIEGPVIRHAKVKVYKKS